MYTLENVIVGRRGKIVHTNITGYSHGGHSQTTKIYTVLHRTTSRRKASKSGSLLDTKPSKVDIRLDGFVCIQSASLANPLIRCTVKMSTYR